IYRKSDFLYRARSGKWKVNQEDCRKAYVKECEELAPIETFADNVPTWSGIFDTIGGVAEYFENPYSEKTNLFISHANLPAASTWHELGRYAHWNGSGFAAGDYEFSKEEKEIDFQYPIRPGFRCMKI